MDKKKQFKHQIVKCSTKDLWSRVLQKIEDESDLLWISGAKPTNINYYYYNPYLYIRDNLTHNDGGVIRNTLPIVTAEEFLATAKKYNKEQKKK